MDPVFDCTYVLDAQVMFSCVEEWKSNKMPDMFKQLELAPFSRPVLFLQVENLTLYGDSEEYKMFRSKPLSYQIRPFDHLHGPGYAHSQTLVQIRLHVHVQVHVKMHIHTLSPAPCLSLSRSLSLSLPLPVSLSPAPCLSLSRMHARSLNIFPCLTLSSLSSVFFALLPSLDPHHPRANTHTSVLFPLCSLARCLFMHTRAISHKCKYSL